MKTRFSFKSKLQALGLQPDAIQPSQQPHQSSSSFSTLPAKVPCGALIVLWGHTPCLSPSLGAGMLGLGSMPNDEPEMGPCSPKLHDPDNASVSISI